MTEDIERLATEYLEAREDANAGDVDVEQWREQRAKWEERMAEVDEDDPLYEVANTNFEEADEKLKAGQQSEERYTQLREKVLQATANRFLPRGPWISEAVLRALNLIALGEDRASLTVETFQIDPDSPVEDDEALFDVAMAVRRVAGAELGDSSELSEFWDRFSELERFTLFEAIAQADQPLTGKDVAIRLGREADRQTISQSLIDTTNGDVNPYYKQGRGEYTLSFVGEYLVRAFGSGDGDETDADEDDSDDDSAALSDF